MSYKQSFIIFLILSICSVASWILGYRSYRMASRYKRELDILKGLLFRKYTKKPHNFSDG